MGDQDDDDEDEDYAEEWEDDYFQGVEDGKSP